MKYLISTLTIVFFLSITLFTQAQEKQPVKKETKIEKQNIRCSTTKSTASPSDKNNCCSKTEKSENCKAKDEKCEKQNPDCCKSNTDKPKN